MPISEARFRLATPGEQDQARGYRVVNAVTAPFLLVNKAVTSIFMVLNSHNTLLWDRPLAQKMYDDVMHDWGFKPEHPYIVVRYSFLNTSYYFSDAVLNGAFFEIHRNGADNLFTPNQSIIDAAGILTKCFPGMSLEDFMGTCNPEQTRFLHGLLLRKLNRKAISRSFGVITEKCREILKLIKKSPEPVNFGEMARLYAAQVFGQSLCDDPNIGLEIGKLIHDFKSYIIRMFTKQLTTEDENFTKTLSASIQKSTQAVLEAKEDIPLFAGSNMTLPQKQAMLFLTLFAAQDNTATLLTAMVAHLNNLDLDQRRDLIQAAEQHVRQSNRTPFQYPQIIKKYLEDVLKLYPPVPLVARGAKEDLCIDFKLEGDDQQYTKFIPKGSNIAARMIDVGDRFFGEQGPHTCPGKDLAKVEVLEFFVQLLGNYYTGMPVNQDYHIETQITGVLKPDVKLRIWDKKR